MSSKLTSTIAAIILFSLCSGASVAQTPGSGATWYNNPKHKFKVLFKGNPKVSSQAGPQGTVTDTFTYSDKNGATMVGITVLPAVPQGDSMINRSLEGACDGAIKTSNCVETGRKACVLQGYPGRELTATVPGRGLMKARIYLIKKKLYQQIVAGVPTFVDSPYAKDFLKSFSVQ
ncbi:MAG: hypothetical protein K2X93_16605 [Candidatus Obscuribacterales bacterium]|nr:hypothetical protein [Candidatus Obscuribacterales bacterium]